MRIGFTGDFFINGRLSDCTENQLLDAFNDLRVYLAANDFNVIDLEAPITESDGRIEKTGPNIKNPLLAAEILRSLNCSLCATANNHFFDFGTKGLMDTYDQLKLKSIDWVGSGLNKKEASDPYIFDDGEVKVGIVNICENEWTTIFPGENEAGCYGLDVIDLTNSIESLSVKVDHVVVVYHGGHEHYNLPSPRIKKLLRYCVDKGASAVIAHHTHVISGYEIYKEAPIFYSLGNLCFAREDMQNSPWNYGMIVNLSFKKEQPAGFDYQFINQNSQKPGVVFVSEEEKERLDKNLVELNRVIESNTLLLEAFEDFTSSKKLLYNFWVQSVPSKLFRLVAKGLFPSLLTRTKRKLLSNLIRCESHRDVLLSTLKK